MSKPLLVPNAWPFGEGVLLTAIGEDAPTLWVVACPDGFTQADGKTPQESWDRWRELGGPHLVLHFSSPESVDRLIADLIELKEKHHA